MHNLSTFLLMNDQGIWERVNILRCQEKMCYAFAYKFGVQDIITWQLDKYGEILKGCIKTGYGSKNHLNHFPNAQEKQSYKNAILHCLATPLIFSHSQK